MGWCATTLFVVAALLTALLYQQYRNLAAPLPLAPLDTKAYWGAGSAAKYKESTLIQAFTVSYAAGSAKSALIADLQADLKRPLKLVEPLEGVAFEYGVNSVALQEIVRYWRDDYLPRWEQREKFLNQFPQFTTQIQGLNIHYIHAKPTAAQAKGRRTVPLLLLHGWPGSVREFYEIIPKLVAPDAHKGDIVFEVIVPSLPGYGWSQGAAKRDFGVIEMSVVLRNLMLRLGHKRFVVQGGDWGSALGSSIATAFPENTLGYHSNMCFSNAPLVNLKKIIASFRPESFVASPEHVEYFYPATAKFLFLIEESGYMHLQATKPDTIGTVLAQTPVGLLAYIVEKFSTWTRPEYQKLPQGGWEKFSPSFRDAVLDNIMIYYLTNSIVTSQRLYAEAFTFKQMAYNIDRVPTAVPTGCARFRNDLAHLMDWQLAEKFTNLVHSTFHRDGGHFAAMEKADVLYVDFVEFVKKAKL